MLWVASTFVLLGGGAWLGVNLAIAPSPSSNARPPTLARSSAPARPAPVTPPTRDPARQTTVLDETPRLPALEYLASIGLTAGAEGIPRVELAADRDGAAQLAGREACRFAYAVWEFSANQTFRFGSTCDGVGEGWLIGAYEVRGGEIHTSPLEQDGARWSSVFEVAHPAKMRSHVQVGRARFDVHQRVTAIRRGLHGEDFRVSFRDRNHLSVPSGTGRGGGEARSAPEARSPASRRLEDRLTQ